jgi:bifunctional DNase/RNase
VHEMRVRAVGVEPGAHRPVLLLEEATGDHRLLPVWIGAAEANAITLEQRGISGPRPMTHQLIGHVLTAFGRRLERVRAAEVRDNIFSPSWSSTDTRVSARVSDAVALALHLGIPIHAEDTVLAAAAVTTRSLVSGTILRRWTRSSSSAGSSTPPPRRTSTQSG